MDWLNPHDALALAEAVLSIVVINLVLSGDNAVVIGMASRRLARSQQRQAMALGALGAIVLRVLFTIAAAVLLDIPLLAAFGGVLLIWIAFRLIREENEGPTVNAGKTLFEAVYTIVLADLVMSLDNILAVAGAAHGDIPLLVFGLLLSMPIILFGSGLVAALMNRLPWLVYAGSAVLAYTAAGMFLDEPLIARYLPGMDWFKWSCIALVVGGTLAAAYFANHRDRRAGPRDDASDAAPTGAARHETGAMSGTPHR
ncbi:MAG TPA: TerC family protein [Thermomicrobiales bacterium]|nr:TerC family protein [Thermomicrobiales bacterium]